MSQSPQANSPLLSVEQIVVFYEQSILALRGVTLQVGKGQMVALLGANGAGKSTTLKAISSLVRAERGEVTKGRVVYQGQAVTDTDPANLVLSGLAQVLEGRHCFTHLSVEQNLLIGGYSGRPSRKVLDQRLELVDEGSAAELATRQQMQNYYLGAARAQVVN